VTITTIDVRTVQPFSHEETMALQKLELDRALGFLRSLDEAAWGALARMPVGTTATSSTLVGARSCHSTQSSFAARLRAAHMPAASSVPSCRSDLDAQRNATIGRSNKPLREPPVGRSENTSSGVCSATRPFVP
jgi:hypothetical protein